jgi:YHS domain-containing protein
MKKLNLAMIAMLVILLAGGTVYGQEQPAGGKAQATCPVMGGQVNKQIYTDYQGQRIYFCCSACVEPFKKGPEKYLKKLQDQGVTLEKSPAAK